MPRPPKCRWVEAEPLVTYFKPAGIPKHELEELILSVDELEAIRLKDLEGLDQEACAEKMHVSRPTFQRILSGARTIIAEAIVLGKAVRVEGGHYQLGCHRTRCRFCSHDMEHSQKNDYHHEKQCPSCGKQAQTDDSTKNIPK